MKRVRLRIHGRVQGVFFRQSASEEAARHGVAGWVRNLPDGTVELVVEGPAEAVDAVARWARSGPPDARVDEVEATVEEPTGEAGFAVRG